MDALRTIRGLERAEIVRPGYAVEYDFVLPTQLYSWLEAKAVRGPPSRSQTSGTSGYEEQAGQAIVADRNAALRVKGLELFIPDRDARCDAG